MKTILKAVFFAAVLILTGCLGGGGLTIDGMNISEIEQRAEKGEVTAQFRMGLAYEQGVGVYRDLEKAAMWFEKAAEQGMPEAQIHLGRLYQKGQGVEQDYKKAVQWYEKAADQGGVDAYARLGFMYFNGFGVLQDRPRAVALFQRGAEQNDIDALYYLGIAYWQGKGVEQDYVQAYKWLDLAKERASNIRNQTLKWRVDNAHKNITDEMSEDQIEQAKALSKQYNKAKN